MSSKNPAEVAEVSDDAAEAIAGSTSGSGGDGGGMFSGVSLDALDGVPKRVAKAGMKICKARGDGVGIEEVKERYPVGDGPAMVAHEVTRMVGADDVPPPFGILVGALKTKRDGWKE
jgi:hypothetical protein